MSLFGVSPMFASSTLMYSGSSWISSPRPDTRVCALCCRLLNHCAAADTGRCCAAVSACHLAISSIHASSVAVRKVRSSADSLSVGWLATRFRKTCDGHAGTSQWEACHKLTLLLL